MSAQPQSNHTAARGTVILVALCFVAVLGIALASYLAVCSRAMQLSNRAFQNDLSRQLAEAGIEEGLRSFNKNEWGAWSSPPTGMTVSAWTKTATTNVKRARRTIALNSTRLGQGASATIEIRVDNYDASTLGADYNSSATYRIGDVVNSGGTWYRAVTSSFSSQAPTSTGALRYWVPEPLDWQWSASTPYALYEVVNYNGTWYRCHTAHTSATTFATTNWSAIPITSSISLSFSSSTTYSRGAMVFSNGVWYYSINSSNVGNTPPNATWWAALPTPVADTYSGSSSYASGDYVTSGGTWYRYTGSGWVSGSAPYISWMYRTGVTYSFNDIVFYSASGSGEWYRCKAPTSSNVPTNTSDWEKAVSGSMHAWASGKKYNIDDVVFYTTDNKWYRCIDSHTSGTITPSSSSYWSGSPLFASTWKPNKQYSQYDTVRYKGLWYIALATNNAALPNTNSSTNWAVAPRAAASWDAGQYYERDDVVSYSGTWYQAIYPSKAQTPSSSSTYWATLTTASSGNSVFAWSPSTAYSTSAYVSYGGIWYKCISATTANAGHTPNNTNYWTPSWKQSWQALSTDTAGAPVIYAEATVTLGDRTTTKTQLRATIARAPLFPNAIGANSSISLGSAGTVDSYDGSIYAQATQGTLTPYTHAMTTAAFSATNTNVGYSAVLAANGTASPSLTITGNATIQGYLAAKSSSSTLTPLVQYATGALLKNSDGTVTSANASYAGVDLTRISRSPYVPQFTTWPVSGTSNPTSELNAAFTADNFPKGLALPSASAIYLGTPGAIVPSRYYVNGDLTLNGSPIATVNIMGPVILYINGNLTINTATTNLINIYATGSAEIHVSGVLTIATAGNGIFNRTLDPKNLIIICDTTSNTAQTYGDVNNVFYGVIYMPNTTNSNGLYFNHSTTATTFWGAISANKVTYRVNALHYYDTSLRHTTFGGVDQPYTVTNLLELSTAEAATMP